jgi:uncharacterized membrane protein YraQ (UPF0718 family)
MKRNILIILAALALWPLIYFNLTPISDYIIDNIFHLAKGEHLTEALRFFIFEVPKVLMLLILIVFAVGLLRSYFSAEKTKKALEGKPLFIGNVLASTLGIVTPFCSCSAIPLFLGFVEAGIPIGVTFSFLIAAPMINEVAIILLYSYFGWQTAAIYVGAGLTIAIFSGWIIGKLGMEKHVQDWVYQVKSGSSVNIDDKKTFADRIDFAIEAVNDIVKKVWLYIVIGIAVGAGIHGYVPENYMAGLLGADTWYSVPLAVLIGIPMYSNAAGVTPIIIALFEKGASLGSALAFMMAVIGLSLPEIIILKKVLKTKLIMTFVGVVGGGIILVGYLFNFIFK